MKYFFSLLALVLAIILTVSTGCGLFPGSKSTDEKKAIDTLAEFSIINNLAVLNTLEIFSDGFTRPLFDENIDITTEDYDNLFAMIAELAAYEEAVTTAVSVLVPQEMAYPYKIVLAGMLPPQTDIAPRSASPGILDSFKDFFGFLGGTGKRSRERIINLTQTTTEAQKRQLYNGLRPEWKTRAGDHNEFFQKLQQGEFDSQASQIHNDFYHNPDLGFYQDAAQYKGEGTAAIAYKEGGEMVKKGSQFYADAASTVIGKSLPGFEKGVDAVKDMNEKAEKFEEYVKTAYKDGLGEAVKQGVADAAKNKFEKMGTDALKGAFGDEIGESVATFVKNVVETKSPDKGYVTVTSPEQKHEFQNVIAFNKDDAAPVKMLAYIGETDKPATLTLPEGEFVLVATDEKGENTARDTVVSVTGGEEKVVSLEAMTATGQIGGLMDAARDKLQDALKELEEIVQAPEGTTGAPAMTSEPPVATTGTPGEGTQPTPKTDTVLPQFKSARVTANVLGLFNFQNYPNDNGSSGQSERYSRLQTNPIITTGGPDGRTYNLVEDYWATSTQRFQTNATFILSEDGKEVESLEITYIFESRSDDWTYTKWVLKAGHIPFTEYADGTYRYTVNGIAVKDHIYSIEQINERFANTNNSDYENYRQEQYLSYQEMISWETDDKCVIHLGLYENR